MKYKVFKMLRAKDEILGQVKKVFTKKHSGVDGIFVTIGLCIIALLLCVVMKDQLTTFVETIMGNLTTKAQSILGI